MTHFTAPHALVFPGQGSQRVGMGAAALGASSGARRVCAEASDVLGWRVDTLCREGPASRLNSTRFAQVAVHVTNLAIAQCLTEQGAAPKVVAGHSVGELAALVFAGALSAEQSVNLVDARARLMASLSCEGGMLCVVGLTVPEAEELCREMIDANDGILCVAADNAPRNLVVSGHRRELVEVNRALAGRSGVRTVPVRTSGPFHSRGYEAILTEWTQAVDAATFRAPDLSYVSSVCGAMCADVSAIRQHLIDQPVRRVLWRQAARAISSFEIATLIEAGEGNTAARLARAAIGRQVSAVVGHRGSE